MDDPVPPKSSLPESTKTTIMVLVALVVVLIVAGLGIATVRDATETVREATATTVTTAPAPGGSTTPPGSAPTTGESRLVEDMKAQVAAIRGLAWKAPLTVRVLTKEQLSQRVRDLNAEEIAEHREEIAGDEALLKFLKLLPRELDYAKTVDDLLAGLVLGFYDDETKELFVGGDVESPDAATRSTLAHELTHALTDQHFDFGRTTKTLDDENRTEEAFALSALIEGDANLVEELWQERHLTDRERLDAALGGSADGRTLARTPPYILASLRFPYEEGLTFVKARHRAGGFAEVDNAYRRPPTSTEHILHPETYAAGQTWTPPPLPDLAAATGCTRVDTGTLGEFDMAQVLIEEVNRTEARNAAQGWNGDAFAVVRCGTALGMADRWQADNPNEAGQLADALLRWGRGWSSSGRAADAEGRFTGPAGTGRVIRNGARVDLILADDAATFDRVARALAG